MLRRVQHHDAGIHRHRVDHLHRRTGWPRIRRWTGRNHRRRIRCGICDHCRGRRRRRRNVSGVLEGGPRDHGLDARGTHAQYGPRGFQPRRRERRRWQRQRENRYAERLLRAIFESRRIDCARILLKVRVRRVDVKELHRGGRWLPVFTRRQRAPSRQFRVVQPVHVARLEHRGTGRHPHPAEVAAARPTAVMIRNPAPRFVADPGVAQRIVPSPPAVLERRPAVGHLRPPHRAQVRLHPLSRAIQIHHSIALCHVHTGGGGGQGLVAILVPAVQVHCGHLAVQPKTRRIGRLYTRRLAFPDVDLRRRAGEPHRAFDHGNPAHRGVRLQAHACAAPERRLRARHRQRQRIRAARLAREVRHPVI